MAAPREEDPPQEIKRTNMGGRGMAKREFCLPPPPHLSKFHPAGPTPNLKLGVRVARHVIADRRRRERRVYSRYGPCRVATPRTWFGVIQVFIFGMLRCLGSLDRRWPVALMSQPCMGCRGVDNAWFSQLQQTSVQEIREVPVPFFLVSHSPERCSRCICVFLKLWKIPRWLTFLLTVLTANCGAQF